MSPYKEFTARLKLLISKNPHLITTTLSNIFTMRLIGNKTHGDLAEIAVAEFINQFMYDFKSVHVGKDLYRAKEREEEAGYGRKHPVFRFHDGNGDYVCEVRYGSGTANALQRGLWTHTKNGFKYFEGATNGWIDYSHNHVLVKLFSHALVATSKGHEAALKKLKQDIQEQKQRSQLR